MKIKFLLLISLFFRGSECFGQVMFQKIISNGIGASATAIEQTTDSGYILTGSFDIDSVLSDACLIKLDKNGDTLWIKTYGVIDRARSITVNSTNTQQTKDGGYILTGEAGQVIPADSETVNLFVIKTNNDGDTLWTRSYANNDLAYSIQQTIDHGYIVSGNAEYANTNGDEVCLLKIDSTGNPLWNKTFSRFNGDVNGFCVRQTSDSGYIVCGSTSRDQYGDTSDVYLIKTNADGDTSWTKAYGGTNSDLAYVVEQTNDSGYIMVGTTNSFGAGGLDVYLIKTKSNGDTLWTRTYGGPGDDEGADVHQTNDGGYIIAGTTIRDNVFYVYLIKTNADGDTSWTKIYGSGDANIGNAVQQTADSGYVITGSTQYKFENTPKEYVYIIKTDANGNSDCNQINGNTTVGSTHTIVGPTHTTLGSEAGTGYLTGAFVGSGGIDSTLCSTLGIDELSKDNTVLLYPNPATDQLTITGNWKANQNYTLTITNLLGETIYTQAANSKQQTVNCKPFSSGLYFVRIADEKESWVGKFVKE